MATVWLTRGVSNNVALIAALQRVGLTVVVSHTEEFWAGRAQAQHFMEPDLGGTAYVQWVADTVEQSQFDWVLPGRCLGDFQAFPAHLQERLVLGCSPQAINIVDDKALFYQHARAAGLPCVADFEVFKRKDEFMAALQRMRQRHEKLCFKPCTGVFARGFRVLTDYDNPLKAIEWGSPLAVRTKDMLRWWEERPEHVMEPMVLMPLFNGKELSVDASFDGRNYRMCARLKNGTAGQRIVTDPQVYTQALKVAQVFGLKGFFNIQFMKHNDQPMLLEVNPRPAGGMGMSLLSDVELVVPQVFGAQLHGGAGLIAPTHEQSVFATECYTAR